MTWVVRTLESESARASCLRLHPPRTAGRSDVTTIYDPQHPDYTSEAPVREELTRVFDVCQTCRRCVDLCASFPTLFEMLDRHDDHDAGWLTPAQQDLVVEQCFHCTACAVDCPYSPDLVVSPDRMGSPDPHATAVDMPRLMLRANAMMHANGHKSARAKLTTTVLGRTNAIGRLATRTPALANRIVGAAPGSIVRRLLARTAGISSARRLEPFAAQRFSRWFARRPTISLRKKQGRVSVVPTCVVEYQRIEIAKDLVKVYERNGIECTVSDVGCCGAPSLHGGDLDRFRTIATSNVETLAAQVRRGIDIVVAQPTCGHVIRHRYAEYMEDESRRADADLVATHTHDAAEYLMKIHEADHTVLDTGFVGDVRPSIVYHLPSALRGRHSGFKSRDLLKLTGARVTVVQERSAMDAMWGLRAGNEDVAVPAAQRLASAIENVSGARTVAGDCALANTAIQEQTGRVAAHPLQLLARAYGIPEEN